MRRLDSSLGQVLVAPDATALHRALLARLLACPAGASVALTGGSTPKAFYGWMAEQGAAHSPHLAKLFWTVSDERHVPLDHPDSNWGVAAAGLLDRVGIPAKQRLPWPVQLPLSDAADTYATTWAKRFGAQRTYDLCLLGMGDDLHTASLFPQSPLLAVPPRDFFAAVQVPGKGGRLTITLAGLAACTAIVVIVAGAGKAKALREALRGEAAPLAHPIQNLAPLATRVTWLIDEAAAAGL